jgi:hypothetical protein
MPAGRPSKYKEQAEIVLELLSLGRSLRQIAAVKGMPDEITVLRWVVKHPEFREQYARARERQAEFYATQMIDIADDVSNDVTGELKMPNNVAVQRAKLQIDTRKWIAAKLLPKKYGDRVDMNVSGELAIKRVVSDI